MQFDWKIISGVVGVVILLGAGVWYLVSSGSEENAAPTTSTFGTGNNQSTVGVSSTDTSGENGEFFSTAELVDGRIFKIAEGPVAGATLIQTGIPTTTVARYVMQDDGHVADLQIETAGVVPRAVSNTTIPGIARVEWARKGSEALLQYEEEGVVKTVYLGFPDATATTTQPVRIQFLPNNILDIATSPSGDSIAYLLRTAAGIAGYIAETAGNNPQTAFALPLEQVRISWPAPSTILAHTKASAGVEGIAFSIGTEGGAVSPILYTPGLTAAADRTFTYVMYQTAGAERSTYIHNNDTGTDVELSFSPYPEKCVLASTNSVVMFCAVPLEYVPGSHLDDWYKGNTSISDFIVAFNLSSGNSLLIATPGEDGGTAADIAEMAISPDDKYLLYITKGDRSLWGVRLFD